MTSSHSPDPTLRDFLESVDSVLLHLRQLTALPNWALTRNGAAGAVVLASSSRASVLRGRPTLDRRRYLEVIAAPVFDDTTGSQFGSLVGYVTERDVAAAGDLDVVHEAVRERARSHQNFVDLLASLLSSSLAVDRRQGDLVRSATLGSFTGRDELTGLLDRASWAALTVEESARLCRLGDPGAVVLIELTGGPGDASGTRNLAADADVLQVAGVLRAAVGTTGVAARLRGPEFSALFVGEDSAARALALTKELSTLDAEVSCGMAEHTNASMSLAETMAEADALLSARAGGLRVCRPRPVGPAQRFHSASRL